MKLKVVVHEAEEGGFWAEVPAIPGCATEGESFEELLRERRRDMKAKAQTPSDDLRPEYDFDFSKAERGRYYKRLLQEGSNIVVLEPDIAEAFPDSASVNDALRSLLEFARLSTGLTRRSAGRAKKRRTQA